MFSFHDKSLDSWKAILESISSAGFDLKKCYPVQAETRTGAHTSNKNSIGIDMMLVCQKNNNVDFERSDIQECDIDTAINYAKDFLITTLDRFKKVEADLTIPDLQNIAIASFFTSIKGYCFYNKNFKNKLLKALQNLLDNIDIIANNYNIADKRTGWWSELYRDKWNV